MSLLECVCAVLDQAAALERPFSLATPLGTVDFALGRPEERERIETRLRPFAGAALGRGSTVASLPDASLYHRLMTHMGARAAVSIDLPNGRGAVMCIKQVNSADERFPPSVALLGPLPEAAVVIADPAHPLWAHVPARLAINMLFAWAVHQGGVLLHGAVLVRDGRGVLLVGRKFAGKTSLALRLMQEDAFDLVTNDKSIALPADGGPGAVRVVGAPLAVGFWSDMVGQFPELKVSESPTIMGHYRHQRRDQQMKRYFLEPTEVAASFGRSYLPEMPVAAVVSVSLDIAGQVGCRLERVAAGELAGEMRLDAFSPVQFWNERMGLANGAPQAWPAWFGGALRGIACFRLTYAPSATGQAVRALRRALSQVGGGRA